MISAILLAAGQSQRMKGQNKLLKQYKGKYLINHILNTLVKSKVNNIFLVLGFQNLHLLHCWAMLWATLFNLVHIFLKFMPELYL